MPQDNGTFYLQKQLLQVTTTHFYNVFIKIADINRDLKKKYHK